MAFIRLLLLNDDGPAHHDCRLRVLASAGIGQENNGGETVTIVDCSNWPPGQLEEWMGAGGLVELSKVLSLERLHIFVLKFVFECLTIHAPLWSVLFRSSEFCCQWLAMESK
jgi:hypothetical protein